MFLAVYIPSRKPLHRLSNQFSLHYTTPTTFKPEVVSDEIKSVSKSFEAIYAQAQEADHLGLDLISGIGYRKSLEFLVREYCISKFPEKEDEIKGKFLGGLLKDDIEDPRIKSMAERATWLGNDETHYIRKHEGKTVEDLKVLIQLLIRGIESEVLAQKLEDEITKK